MTAKNTLIFDGDLIPKLFAMPNDPNQLSLMFETLDERVIIPLFIRNPESAIELIVKFFQDLDKEFISEEEGWNTA